MGGEKHCDVSEKTSQCFEQNITVFFLSDAGNGTTRPFHLLQAGLFIVVAGYG